MVKISSEYVFKNDGAVKIGIKEFMEQSFQRETDFIKEWQSFVEGYYLVEYRKRGDEVGIAADLTVEGINRQDDWFTLSLEELPEEIRFLLDSMK